MLKKHIKKVFILILAAAVVSAVIYRGNTIASNSSSGLKVTVTKKGEIKVLSGKKDVSKGTYQLQKGGKVKLNFSGSGQSVEYRSSNAKILKVTKKGAVTAKKAGKAKIGITVKKQDGAKISANLGFKVNDNKKATVYMTTDISSEGLQKIYKKLNWKPSGKLGVKVSTGEPPASNYLRPKLIGDLVKSLHGTIIECNTAYGGSRSGTKMHLQVAKDHGFTQIADVDIMDADGSASFTVNGGIYLKKNLVGKNLKNYKSVLVLSHFKGHSMAGFGGAIKNISIGMASSAGKCRIHTGGESDRSMMGGDQDAFLESMGEAGKSVADYFGKNIVYINVMNRLSVDCDCDGNPAKPDMHDVGILASTDPVALDQACVDLIYAEKDKEGKSLVKRIESRNGLHTLENAERLGLGSRTYKLIKID